MTDLTRSRLICGLGALLGFAGLAAGHFHWPPVVAPWSRVIATVAFGITLSGVQGIRYALKDRRIDAALKD